MCKHIHKLTYIIYDSMLAVWARPIFLLLLLVFVSFIIFAISLFISPSFLHFDLGILPFLSVSDRTYTHAQTSIIIMYGIIEKWSFDFVVYDRPTKITNKMKFISRRACACVSYLWKCFDISRFLLQIPINYFFVCELVLFSLVSCSYSYYCKWMQNMHLHHVKSIFFNKKNSKNFNETRDAFKYRFGIFAELVKLIWYSNNLNYAQRTRHIWNVK